MSEWRAVPGYEGKYEVSDDGQVRSLLFNRVRTLKPARNQSGRGYLFVALGARNLQQIHSLVALAFIGPRPEGHVVRHLDGDKENNAPTNLAYGTVRENILDTVGHGHHHYAKRTHCPQGHEFSPENTYVYTRTTGLKTRSCRECERLRAITRAAARKAAVSA